MCRRLGAAKRFRLVLLNLIRPVTELVFTDSSVTENFTPEQAMKAQRGGSGSSSALPVISALDRGWMVNATTWPLYPRGRDAVAIVKESECVPWPVWTGAENLAPTEIRSRDRPARTESQYRLSYRVPPIVL